MLRALLATLICTLSLNAAEQKSWMFVLQATSGEVTPIKNDKATLLLRGITTGIAFTDRPSRNAKVFTAEQLVTLWKHGENNFKDQPPNAALGLLEDNQDTITVFELTKPSYNPKTKVLTFEATHLKNPTESPVPNRNLNTTLPTKFHHSVIIIDSVGGGGFGF